MLSAAHRGYEYQDLLIATRLADVLLGRITDLEVDRKLFSGDLFDDLTTIDSYGRRERVQIKHTSKDAVPLELSVFTTHARSLRFDALVGSIIADREGYGKAEAPTLYRVVARNTKPEDPRLIRALQSHPSDPGPFIPGMSSIRLQFVASMLWPAEPAHEHRSDNDSPWAFLRTCGISRADFLWACDHLVIEVESPVASLDLTSPGPAELLLLDRVRRDVGAESYPNENRFAVDVAAAMVGTARAARLGACAVSKDELLRRSRLRSDFGAVARSHPVDPEVEIRRPNAVGEIVRTIGGAADKGVPLLLLGPPGQGKSWCCHQVVDALSASGWLVAEHYCYLGQADCEREARVLGEAIIGSLLHRLAEEDPTLVREQRPRFAADTRTLREALARARESQPDRRVALFVDGLDHVTRVRGATTGRADPSYVVANELAALECPPGTVLVVLSQPGEHINPLRTKDAEIAEIPPLGERELGTLAARLGVFGRSGGQTTSAPIGMPRPSVGSSENSAESAFIAALRDRSAGNALYATYLCREVLRHPTGVIDPVVTVRALPAFDGTLEAYYKHLISSLATGTSVIADLLALLDFSVTRAELREILPTVSHRVDAALDLLKPVLIERAGQSGVRIYHESFARFLCQPFASDPIAAEALLGTVTSWLEVKGMFHDSRAFRFLLSTLARAGRHREVVDHIAVDFTARSVAACFAAIAIADNLAIAAGCAVRIGDWSSVVRCIELSRAAYTYEEESITGHLIRFLDVPLSLLGSERISERLLHDGRPTLSGRLGLQICSAADSAGADVPWAEYLDEFERASMTDNTSYGAESDLRVSLATLRGRLRLAVGNAPHSEPPEGATADDERRAVPPVDLQHLADWLRKSDLPRQPIVDAICDTLGIELTESLLSRLEGSSELILAFAERLANGQDGAYPERAQPWIDAAARTPAPGSCHRLLALGHPMSALVRLALPLRDRLLTLTREVQAKEIRFETSPLLSWLDLCTAAARSDHLALATSEALIYGEGWYRCWLRFVVALCRSEASLSKDQSATALAALEILTEDLRPFAGSPRTCDLSAADETISTTFRRALRLINEDDWTRALEILRKVSDETTTKMQGVYSGSLPPTILLSIVVDATTPARRAAIDDLIAKIIETRAGGCLYSYIGEFYLCAARHALTAGDRDAARTHWEQACRMLTAYGWHKDITIYELLDSLPVLIDTDQDRAREAVAVAQPLCWLVARHTDGKETRHAPARWWDLLAVADPEALATLVAPLLLRSCNLPNQIVEDARLELWRAHYAQADPLVAGALRLTLEPGLEESDPDALSRLVDVYKQTGSRDAASLIRLLLARADERKGDYGTTDQKDRLRKDQSVVDRLNKIAERAGAPRIDATISSPQAGAKGSTSAPKTRYDRQSLADFLDEQVVEPFDPGAIGLGSALRSWRVRPYDALGRRWEIDRFINAIGYRLLELVDQSYFEDAQSVLTLVASEQRFGDNGGLLAGLGAGLEVRGYANLASVALTFAWTRTRGGGGWLNFGGEDSIEALRQAATLDPQAALRIIGDEVQRVVRRGGFGVSQALIHAFARVSFGSSTEAAPVENWTKTAFSCWHEAAKVISYRTPRVHPTDAPECSYSATNSRTESQTEKSAHCESVTRPVGEHLEKLPETVGPSLLDQAFVTAAVAGLAHPAREQKRRCLVAIQLLLTERTDPAARACAVALENASDPATLAWLLRIIETSPVSKQVARCCVAPLRARCAGPHLTVRALAGRLLSSIGIAVDSPPPLPQTRLLASTTAPTEEMQRVAAIVSNYAECRLDSATWLFPGLRSIVRRRVAVALAQDDWKARWEHQAQSLASRTGGRAPDAIVWVVEIVEDALQQSAAEGRAHLLARGAVVADPIAWESKLADVLLNDPWLPLAMEWCREPRPVQLPDPGAELGTIRVVDSKLAPKIEGGRFDGWRLLASAEWRTEPSTWNRTPTATTSVFCGIETSKSDSPEWLQDPPVDAGDASVWLSSPTHLPVDAKAPGRGHVCIDPGSATLGDVAEGLGLPIQPLGPSKHLVVSLGLRPGAEPLQLVDDTGPAIALRTWRAHYEGGRNDLARPLFCGAQLLARSDVFERIRRLSNGDLVWREFVSAT